MRGFIAWSSSAQGCQGARPTQLRIFQCLQRRFDYVERRIQRLAFDYQRRRESHHRLARFLGKNAALQKPFAKSASVAPCRIDVQSDEQTASAYFLQRRMTQRADRKSVVVGKTVEHALP